MEKELLKDFSAMLDSEIDIKGAVTPLAKDSLASLNINLSDEQKENLLPFLIEFGEQVSKNTVLSTLITFSELNIIQFSKH